MFKFSLKKGDEVKILTGRDKGKTGKVIHADRKAGRITVEGMNLLTRHQRPKKQGQKGQKVRLPSSMHPSNLMLVCPRCGKPSRTGYQLNEAGQKLRICKKCKGTF